MCKNNLTKFCPVCNSEFPKPYNESKKAWESRHKFCSRACADEAKKEFVHSEESKEKRRKWAIKNNSGDRLKPRYGEENHMWKGGITEENKKIRASPEYKEWRKAVFERDNYTCQICNRRGCNLHADHIKQFAYFPEERLNLDNGRTLCVECHRKTDTYKRKEGFKPTIKNVQDQLKGRELSGVYEKLGSAVHQIDINTDEVINTFRSIHSAAKSLGKNGGSIRVHLGLVKNRNKTKHAHGFKWELINNN